MGKNITDYDKTPDKTHVGGVVYFQEDQPPRIELAGKVFLEGSTTASKESGDFDDELVDYLNNNKENKTNSLFSLGTENSISWKNVYAMAPKAKNYHWQEEIVLGNYTYIPISNSSDYGNGQNRYLGYLRIDGTNQTVSRHNIEYVGANTPQDTSQTYAGFMMVSTGTKLIAYMKTSAGMDCHTSTDGLTWIDETSSFNLATVIGTTSMFTENRAGPRKNAFMHFIHQNGSRYHSVTSFGSSFIWIGNDGTNFKIWKSSDGLSWTDITTSIYLGAGTVTDNYYVNVRINRSISKAFIYLRNSSQTDETYCAYTTDGGDTWTQSTGDALSTNTVPYYLYENPLDANKFLIQTSENSTILAKTEDFGVTWTRIDAPRSPYTLFGIAYFGDYIYLVDTISQGWVTYSSDNGANYSYFDKYFEDFPAILTDKSRVVLVDSRSMMYSTDNVNFNENYSSPNGYFPTNLVGIDANTTIFSNDDDDTFLVTTDGCVTFTQTMKYNENIMNFKPGAGVSASEIGYLENAKMIGCVKNDANTDDNNLFFVERIKEPQWAHMPVGSTIVDGDLRTYFRTK